MDIRGAAGMLVNITASGSLKMKETREVMNTIRAFAAEDATVIFGTVSDDTMQDDLRVTVVATGLGRASAVARKPPLTILRTGTDNAAHGRGRAGDRRVAPAVRRSGHAGRLARARQLAVARRPLLEKRAASGWTSRRSCASKAELEERPRPASPACG